MMSSKTAPLMSAGHYTRYFYHHPMGVGCSCYLGCPIMQQCIALCDASNNGHEVNLRGKVSLEGLETLTR